MPGKLIDGFCRCWGAILARMLTLPKGQQAWIVVVGGGTRCNKLTLLMEVRLFREIRAHGRNLRLHLVVSLVGHGPQLMPHHLVGIRAIFERIFAKHGIEALLGTAIGHTTPTVLVTPKGQHIPYDKVI